MEHRPTGLYSKGTSKNACRYLRQECLPYLNACSSQTPWVMHLYEKYSR